MNTKTTSHLHGMAEELGESSNSIRVELNRFINAGLLTSEYIKNKRFYKANTKHPLYNDINSILRKMVGIDKLVERVTSQIGNLESAYLTGDFASGLDSNTPSTPRLQRYLISPLGISQSHFFQRLIFSSPGESLHSGTPKFIQK